MAAPHLQFTFVKFAKRIAKYHFMQVRLTRQCRNLGAGPTQSTENPKKIPQF